MDWTPTFAQVPNILVVDDEPDNFDVLETLLTELDLRLYYAASGEEGLRMLEVVDIDVILLDFAMPGMNGLEFCRQVKLHSVWSTIPIVMVTSRTASSDLAQSLEAGADDFISKPVNSVELRARLHSMLRIRSQYQKLASANDLQQRAIETLKENLATLRGTFASTIPHEFNTPLMGILFSLELALSNEDSFDKERIRELLTITYRSAVRLENTTQRFLRYATLESLEYPPVGRVSSKTILDIAEPIVKKHDRLTEFACELQEVQLALSQEHLTWIVSELIDNALKFSNPGTRVAIVGRKSNTGYELHFNDWGRGFTSEQIASVGAFMQFERDVYEQQGAGLGLTIAIKTSRLYGGKCEVVSSYGDGTTIRVQLPLAHDSALDNQQGLIASASKR